MYVAALIASKGGAAAAAIFGLLVVLVCLAFAFILIAALWKIFAKAGKPGWAAIIPIYNYFVEVEIIGRPTIWVLYLCIPGVNIYFGILATIDLAKSFGKSTGFAVGMILFPYVCYPILGFGSAQYQGPVALAGAGGGYRPTPGYMPPAPMSVTPMAPPAAPPVAPTNVGMASPPPPMAAPAPPMAAPAPPMAAPTPPPPQPPTAPPPQPQPPTPPPPPTPGV